MDAKWDLFFSRVLYHMYVFHAFTLWRFSPRASHLMIADSGVLMGKDAFVGLIYPFLHFWYVLPFN